jgi:alcohol dehydrogenase class IV
MPLQGVYTYLPQERVVFGEPAASAVIAELDRLGAKRALVVASKSLAANGPVVAAVRDAMGARCAGLFTGCAAHTPRDTVIAAADAVREADADLIVAMGGGTVVDTVKILQLCLAGNVRSIDDMDRVRLTFDADGKPRLPELGPSPVRQIAVPTTLSGAEFSSLGASTDTRTGQKQPYLGTDVCARTVILDPEATLATPEWLWLSTGIRAVDHAVETICGVNANTFCDGLSLHALRLLNEALPRTRRAPGDLEARAVCQQATWMAASSIMRVSYGASHGIGHVLGGLCGVPHGHTSCILLPHVLRWNEAATADRQALIAEALGRPGGAAADAVADLIARLGQPSTLRDAGVTRDQLPQIAALSLGNIFVKTNPRRIERAEDVLEILEAAW